MQAGVDPSDLVVFDPAGERLSEWKRWFAHLKIEHLRSAVVHHPQPQPFALSDFVRARGRTCELLPTYLLPTVALFADFCQHLIDSMGLNDIVRCDTVLGVSPAGEIETELGLGLRLDRVLAARGGGTVPSWMLERISHANRAGRLCRRVGEIVVGGNCGPLELSVGSTIVTADHLWLATGSSPCVTASPPLDRLCRTLDTERFAGRPVLDTSLRLSGSVVHVMGRLAQLQLGPAAGNLAGDRRGAELVVEAVVGAEAMYALAVATCSTR